MRPLMICVAVIVLLGAVQAQSDSDDLAPVKESLKQKVSKKMEGWTYRSVEPIQGSRGVIIQQWRLNDIIVSVAVIRYEKEAQAESAFKYAKAQLRIEEQATSKSRSKPIRLIKEDLMALGDEGFVSDIRGSEAVAFRKGKFIVNVSVPEPQNNKDVFFSRKFAQHVAKVLELQ